MADAVDRAIFVMGMNANEYLATAQRVRQENTALTASQEQVVVKEERVTAAMGRSAGAFERLEARRIKEIGLEQQRQKELATVTRAVEEGTAAQSRAAAVVAQINEHYDRQVAALGRVAVAQTATNRSLIEGLSAAGRAAVPFRDYNAELLRGLSLAGQAAAAQKRYTVSLIEGLSAAGRTAGAYRDVSQELTRGLSAAGRAAAATNSAAAANRGFGSALGKNNFVIQNAAFQVGDFAVQVGAGTNAIRALSLQLPQFFGAFALMGGSIAPFVGLAGVAVAIIGALVLSFTDLGDSTDTSASKLKEHNDLIERANELTKNLTTSTGNLALARQAESQNLITLKQQDIDRLNAEFDRRTAGQRLTPEQRRQAIDTFFPELTVLESQLNQLRAASGGDVVSRGTTVGGDGLTDEMRKQRGDLLKSLREEIDLAQKIGIEREKAAALAKAFASAEDDVGKAIIRLIDMKYAAKIAEENHLLAINTAAANENAAAYLVSAGAAAEAQARHQALLDAMENGVGIQARSQALLDEMAAKAAESAAKQVPALEAAAAAAEARAAAAESGYEAQRRAELAAKIEQATLAETTALEYARGESADLLRQIIERKTAAIIDADVAERRIPIAESLRGQEQQLALITKETQLIGASNVQRAVTLAQMQALIALRKDNATALTDEERRYIRNAEAIARANERLKEQQAAFDELERIGEQAFDRIGAAITEAFTTGKAEAIDFLSVMKGILSELTQAFLKLAAINPLKNALGLSGGTALPTLGTVLGSSTGVGSGINFGSIGGDIFSLGRQLAGGFGIGSYLFGGSPLTGAGGLLTGGGVTSSGAGAVSSGLFGTSSSFLAQSGLGILGAVLPGLLSGNLAQAGLGGAGALAGSFILPGIGTIAGGILGNIIGGLFGGSKKKTPQAVTDITIGAGGLAGVGGNTVRSGGNVAATTSLAEAIALSVNQAVASLGGTLAANAQGGYILNSVGKNTGNQFVAGLGRYGAGGTELQAGFSNPEEAAGRVIVGILQAAAKQGTLTGISATSSTVLRNSKATDLDALNTDLTFAQLYDSLIGVTDQTTDAQKAIDALNKTFSDAKTEALRLGLAIDVLTTAQAAAIAKLTTDFNASIQDQILALTNPAELALRELTRAQEARVKEAERLGADLVEVERLSGLERQRLIEQQASGLRSFFDEITFGGLSGASPGASLQGSRAAFEAATASGDVAGIQTYGRAYLESARSFYASGSGFQDALTRVQGVVGGYLTANDNSTAVVGAVNNVSALMAAQNNLAAQMLAELAALREDNRELREQLLALAA